MKSATPKIVKSEINRRIKSKLGIQLDVGCGENKQQRFLGMDKRDLAGVDIVHNAEIFPWPIPKSSCTAILMSHLWEHIKPWLTIDLMNECWRVMKPGGQLFISTPYATSVGFYQDPTHCNPTNEITFTYFDPAYPLYGIYKPKPWKIARNAYQMTTNMEVILEKRENTNVTKEEYLKARGKEEPLFDQAFQSYIQKPRKTKNKARNRNPDNRDYSV